MSPVELSVGTAKKRALGHAGVVAVGGAVMTSVLDKVVVRCRAHAAGYDAGTASSGAYTTVHDAAAAGMVTEVRRGGAAGCSRRLSEA